MELDVKLLYVTPGYKPADKLGGVPNSSSALAEQMQKRGHDVTVFTTNSNYDEDLAVTPNIRHMVEGVSVWYFTQSDPLKRVGPRYFSQSLGYLYSPAMKVKLKETICYFDLVHTQMPFVYPTYIASVFANKARKPLFYHQRGLLDPERLQFRALKKRLYFSLFEKKILRRATTLIALSDTELENYRKLGVETPCRVVPNGIDVSHFRTAPLDLSHPWAAGMEGKTIVLFLGQLLPIKGPDLLLQAFLRVARAYPDAVLILAGPDPVQMGARLRAIAHSAGLADRVVLTGTVSGESKLDLLARADIFCLPSSSEGFSMAILEAMASYSALLITPGCCFPRLSSAGAGIEVERSIDAITDGLRQLLSSDSVRDMYAQKALTLAQIEYSWEQVARSMEDTYIEGVQRCNNVLRPFESD
jgi:glycosyltransferase involved in cell wall biosynthesis